MTLNDDQIQPRDADSVDRAQVQAVVMFSPDGDAAAFARTVGDLMLDTDRRRSMGAEARQNAERYAPDVVRAQWLNLLA